jgi:hypothetical protein
MATERINDPDRLPCRIELALFPKADFREISGRLRHFNNVSSEHWADGQPDNPPDWDVPSRYSLTFRPDDDQ